MIEFKVYAQGAASVIPSILILVLLVVLIVGSCSILCLKGWQVGKYSVVRLMLVEWVVLVFCSTVFFRETKDESAINLIPLSSYFCIAENSYLKEVAVINLLNVAMFVPVGMLIKISNLNANLGLNNWKVAMVTGLLLSMAIEVLQFVFKKGLCEVDDVIHNVIGCMIGYGVAVLTLSFMKKRHRCEYTKIIK